MNTGDRDTARKILEFCSNEARLEDDVVQLTGLSRIAVRKRLNSLVRRNLVKLTKLARNGPTFVKSTSESKWMTVAPNDVSVESMRVLEALNIRGMTIAEISEATGDTNQRVRQWVYNLSNAEYIVGYPNGVLKRPNVYQLTGKGERLIVKAKGERYIPPQRVNSVFNLGAHLNSHV